MFSYSIYITMAVLIIMGCIDYGGNGLLKLVRTLKEINSARKLISSESGMILRRKILDSTENTAYDFFSEKTLVYQLELFQQEVRNSVSKSKGDYNCDIGEFFNYELLDQIGNSNFNDHIASALTALGVLGTFIGLTIGLNGFDTSSSEQIMNGVSGLLTGMSLAFSTSIAGITLSLIYSTVYRWIRGKAESSLDLFLDDFRKYIINSNKEICINRIQSSLKDLANFSADVTSAINTPMQEMKRSLDKHCEFSTTKQMEALQLMTDSFVDRLSGALSRNINDLSESLLKAEKCTEAYIDSYNYTITALQSIASEITGVNSTLQETIKQYKNVNSGVQKINNSMERKLHTLDEIIAKDIDALTTQSTIISQMVNYSKDLEGIANQVASQSNLAIEAVQTISDCGNDIVKDSQKVLEEQLRVLMLNSSDFANYMYQQSNSFSDFMLKESKNYVTTTSSYLQTAQDYLQNELKRFIIDAKEYELEKVDSVMKIATITQQTQIEFTSQMDRVLSELLRQNENLLRMQSESINILKEIEENSKKRGFFSLRKK